MPAYVAEGDVWLRSTTSSCTGAAVVVVAVHLSRVEGVLEYNVSAPKASASGPEAQTSQTPSLTAFKFLKAQTGCRVPNAQFPKRCHTSGVPNTHV